MMKRLKRWALLLAGVLLVGMMAGCGSGGKGGDTVRIVHKNYTEQRLVGQMLSVYLQSKGFSTEVSELGGTMLCFQAIEGGNADLYAEYTGTGYMAILGETKILSSEETFDFVKDAFEKKYGITWLLPLGWNNTYILSLTSETSEKLGVKTTSELIPYAKDMIIGCDAEFANRSDGIPGLLKAYPGLSFKEIVPMDQGLTYDALKNGKLDVNVSFSSDGRIAKYHLVNLKDDKAFFPPYYCAPMLKKAYAEKHPELVQALNALHNKWTDEDLQKYNLMVDEGMDAKEVAKKMLTDVGMLK